ncbi:MAG TPA: hypothetical protein VKZ53_07120 [Candidatus Angelobacter sp.]|nr:hypothetical protein [Candidatus Angelobacter sp.]
MTHLLANWIARASARRKSAKRRSLWDAGSNTPGLPKQLSFHA